MEFEDVKRLLSEDREAGIYRISLKYVRHALHSDPKYPQHWRWAQSATEFYPVRDHDREWLFGRCFIGGRY